MNESLYFRKALLLWYDEFYVANYNETISVFLSAFSGHQLL